MPPYIYLDISTGHLTPDTRNLLERFGASDRFDIGWPALIVAPYEYGFFVTVPDYSTPEVAEQCKNLPKDLDDVLCHAYKAGAHLVRLDADGDALYDLPHYEED